MSVSLQSRRVEAITVVACAGRIGEGAGCTALREHLDKLMPYDASIVLNLGAVEWIDSSGLGLLVRMLTRAQTLNGDLKLCAVPGKVRDVLQSTRLASLFDVHETEEHAILAMLERRYAALPSRGLGTDILCVDTSNDVLAFVRESLNHAGYRVSTTTNLADGLILLQAMKPRLVIVGSALRAMRTTRAANTFNALLDERAFVELPETFSTDDPGVVGAALIAQVERLMGASSAPAAN
jgi:anti-sigma B factor antagonist